MPTFYPNQPAGEYLAALNALTAAAVTATSTTTLTPALAEKVFTTQASKDFQAGSFIMAISDATPTVWMYGPITSYSGTTLTFTPTVIGTATEKSDWTILGRVGARGPEGLPGEGSGDVVGPASATDGHFTQFDGTTGKLLKGGLALSTSTSLTENSDTVVASQKAVRAYADASIGTEIITPTNTSPADAATDQTETPALTGSTFYSNYAATHAATQVQVHTTSDFTTPQYSSGDQAGSVSFVLPAGQLVVSTTYYWRMRYKNSRGTYSSWSTATTFTTASAFNSYIATPASTPAAMGDSFEGGFYSGLIWNELIQSATSTAIGTGSKTFAVSAGAAYAYSGQALEVRSRADPANKMIGAVTAANLSSVTINVTSVGGSGTFTDWSIMSKYRVIVAPKASGESSSKAYKNANTAAPSACGTLTEGSLATAAMVAAGDATTYPAAHFCNDLSIASYTDWYMPARDELELAWRNLKPTADANYTTAGRPTGATPDYKNLGSYGDTANTHGLNNNSSPTGAAYTAGSPAQVAAGKNFRTSESEAFAYGSFFYWSASEYSTTVAWIQYWHSSLTGYQDYNSKTGAYYVRAVRRSII